MVAKSAPERMLLPVMGLALLHVLLQPASRQS
jgi:hypothetical protein